MDIVKNMVDNAEKDQESTPLSFCPICAIFIDYGVIVNSAVDLFIRKYQDKFIKCENPIYDNQLLMYQLSLTDSQTSRRFGELLKMQTVDFVDTIVNKYRKRFFKNTIIYVIKSCLPENNILINQSYFSLEPGEQDNRLKYRYQLKNNPNNQIDLNLDVINKNVDTTFRNFKNSHPFINGITGIPNIVFVEHKKISADIFINALTNFKFPKSAIKCYRMQQKSSNSNDTSASLIIEDTNYKYEQINALSQYPDIVDNIKKIMNHFYSSGKTKNK